MEYDKCQDSRAKTAASPAAGVVVEESNSAMASRWRSRGKGVIHQGCMCAVEGRAQGYWPGANEMDLVAIDWSDYEMDSPTAVRAVLAEVYLQVVVPDMLLTMLRWVVAHGPFGCHRAVEQCCMCRLAADIRSEG